MVELILAHPDCDWIVVFNIHDRTIWLSDGDAEPRQMTRWTLDSLFENNWHVVGEA